jgi:serine/threonine protein phosphatase PrpC
MLRVAEHHAFTDTGQQRRHNEDAYYARTPVFAVADGMGGAQAGEVASHAAVEAVAAGLPEEGTPEDRLAAVVRRANEEIFRMSREDDSRAGMGTTLTAVHVGESDIAIAHVGDSRAYRFRDGELSRLTEDHSLVEEMRRRGQLTAEEADEHPQRSIITRALGPEPDVLVDTRSWAARDGDVLLLCSDGLTSMISEAQVAEILREATGLEQAGRALIAAANRAGGRDNITVVLLRLEEVGRGAPAGSAHDQPTEVHKVPTQDGAGAPAAVEVRPAVAQAHETGSPASAEAPPRRRMPRRARKDPAKARRSRRGRRALVALAGTLIVLVPVLLGAYLASQAVYFIGTTPDGFVAMYRGLPYDLPAGIDLYSTNYVSGVPVDEVPAGRRATLLDHQLRSHDDAADLVRELEQGRLSAR